MLWILLNDQIIRKFFTIVSTRILNNSLNIISFNRNAYQQAIKDPDNVVNSRFLKTNQSEEINTIDTHLTQGLIPKKQITRDFLITKIIREIIRNQRSGRHR